MARSLKKGPFADESLLKKVMGILLSRMIRGIEQLLKKIFLETK